MVAKKYRSYATIRNFAEHRCHKVPHKIPKRELSMWPNDGNISLLALIDDAASGKFTFNDKHFFFEDEHDACYCKLLLETKR